MQSVLTGRNYTICCRNSDGEQWALFFIYSTEFPHSVPDGLEKY